MAELNETAPKMLECATCLEYMAPPMFKCKNCHDPCVARVPDVANDAGQSTCDQPTEQQTIDNLEGCVENISIHVNEEISTSEFSYDVANEAEQSSEQQTAVNNLREPMVNLSVDVKEELRTSGSKYVVQHPKAGKSSSPVIKCAELKNTAHYKTKKENEQTYTPFKARPATVLKQRPFEPKRRSLPLQKITNMILNTERRAEERQEFENRKKLRETEKENMEQAKKEEEAKAAAEEVARFRQQAVHRANPVRKFKALKEIEKRPLTSPKSPKFCNRLKK